MRQMTGEGAPLSSTIELPSSLDDQKQSDNPAVYANKG